MMCYILQFIANYQGMYRCVGRRLLNDQPRDVKFEFSVGEIMAYRFHAGPTQRLRIVYFESDLFAGDQGDP